MTAPALRHSPVLFPTANLGFGYYDPIKDGQFVHMHDDFTEPRPGGRQHNGLDIGVPEGILIVAPFGGTIIAAGWEGLGGWGVEMETVGHASGKRYTAYFGHLATRPFVSAGEKISGMAILGISGRTGGRTGAPIGARLPQSTPSHLHFRITDGSRPTDPFPQVVKLMERTSKPYTYVQADDFDVAHAMTVFAQMTLKRRH